MECVPKKILLRAPNWIGDHVMAFPFYAGLRDLYPTAHLTLVGRDTLRDLKISTPFEQLLWMPREACRFPFGVWKFGKKMVSGFDLGISLAVSYSASLLLLAAGAKERVGFSQSGIDVFLTAHFPWKGRASGKHKTELYLELLEWLGGSPKKVLTTSEAKTEFDSSIVIAPGASIPLREWPYFTELILTLRKHYPGKVIRVVGSQTDNKWHSFLGRLNLSGVEDWVGKTTLEELLVLFRKASLVIANDSGTAHLSATLAGTQTLVLFGPGDLKYVKPIGKKVTVIRKTDLRCSPCESPHCLAPFGYQACLKGISIEEVFEKICDLIEHCQSVHSK